MKKYSYGSKHGYGSKYTKEKIVGISLAAIGLIIFINSIAIRFLLLIIGIILTLMGILLFIK